MMNVLDNAEWLKHLIDYRLGSLDKDGAAEKRATFTGDDLDKLRSILITLETLMANSGRLD